MVIKDKNGNIDVEESMKSVRADLDAIWPGAAGIGIRIAFCQEEVDKATKHDCGHCRHWDKDADYDDWDTGCVKSDDIRDAGSIDQETASCRYWEFDPSKED